jgi:abscisic-aldehyde oxidase
MAVVFAVNGERFELRDGDQPGATLLDFLRSRTRFTGPKLGCGEGTPLHPSPLLFGSSKR